MVITSSVNACDCQVVAAQYLALALSEEVAFEVFTVVILGVMLDGSKNLRQKGKLWWVIFG